MEVATGRRDPGDPWRGRPGRRLQRLQLPPQSHHHQTRRTHLKYPPHLHSDSSQHGEDNLRRLDRILYKKDGLDQET